MANTPVTITGAVTIVGYTVTLPFVTTDSYTFSFPYLSQDDFEIEVKSETILDAADYAFTSDYLIQLTTTGVNKLNALYGTLTDVPLTIRRRTQVSTRLVDYQDGATLTEADLDLQANQLFYLVQEVYDDANLGSVSFNPVDGTIDLDGAELVDMGEPLVESSGATLKTVLDNCIVPDYTEAEDYRAQRLVFNSGDLYRSNKVVTGAPAVLDVADWDLIFTATQLASITPHIADAHAHQEVDTKANLDTWAATAANGARAYGTDTKKYYGVKDGVLQLIGLSSPATSTDNALVRFDGVTGDAIQDYTSGAPTVSDTGSLTLDGGDNNVNSSSDLALSLDSTGKNGLATNGSGNNIALFNNAVQQILFTTTAIKPKIQQQLINGSVTAPPVAFAGMTDGGIYRDSGSDELRMAINGADSQIWADAYTSVSKILGLGRYTTATLPTPAAANEGFLAYDTDTQTIKASDGSTWSTIGSGGSGGSLEIYHQETFRETGVSWCY